MDCDNGGRAGKWKMLKPGVICMVCCWLKNVLPKGVGGELFPCGQNKEFLAKGSLKNVELNNGCWANGNWKPGSPGWLLFLNKSNGWINCWNYWLKLFQLAKKLVSGDANADPTKHTKKRRSITSNGKNLIRNNQHCRRIQQKNVEHLFKSTVFRRFLRFLHPVSR